MLRSNEFMPDYFLSSSLIPLASPCCLKIIPSLPKSRNGFTFFAAADQHRSRQKHDLRDDHSLEILPPSSTLWFLPYPSTSFLIHAFSPKTHRHCPILFFHHLARSHVGVKEIKWRRPGDVGSSQSTNRSQSNNWRNIWSSGSGLRVACWMFFGMV